MTQVNPSARNIEEYVALSVIDHLQSESEVCVVYNYDKQTLVGVFSTYISALKWGLTYLISGECGDLTLEDFGIEEDKEIDWSNQEIQKAVDFGMADEYMQITVCQIKH